MDPSIYSNDLKSVFTPVWNWPTEGNHKHVSANEKTVETEMTNGAHAFFPASRREDADWLNPKSLQVSISADVNRRFNDQLDKPLWVGTCAEENISWVLDVLLDSLVDPNEQQRVNNFIGTAQAQSSEQQITAPPEISLMVNNMMNRHNLGKARKNVEQILQTILQDRTAEVMLKLS